MPGTVVVVRYSVSPLGMFLLNAVYRYRPGTTYDRSTINMMRNLLGCWKPGLVELGFPFFLAPLFPDFFSGKCAKMGYLTKYCSVLPHFCCNGILKQNVDDSCKNGTNEAVGGWDMAKWWWKVVFTLRAIRHVLFYWQFSTYSPFPSFCSSQPMCTYNRRCLKLSCCDYAWIQSNNAVIFLWFTTLYCCAIPPGQRPGS
jgi:hypothetical protein